MLTTTGAPAERDVVPEITGVASVAKLEESTVRVGAAAAAVVL
jgi:hypothetical protein